MLDVRYSHLYFYQSLNRLQRGLSAIAELLVKKLLLRNHVVNFVEICNVCARKAIIEAAKRIINSDKMCRMICILASLFLEHSVCENVLPHLIREKQFFNQFSSRSNNVSGIFLFIGLSFMSKAW